MSNRTRQKTKGADRQMESNDSSDIPDMGETSAEPGLPDGQALYMFSMSRPRETELN